MVRPVILSLDYADGRSSCRFLIDCVQTIAIPIYRLHYSGGAAAAIAAASRSSCSLLSLLSCAFLLSSSTFVSSFLFATFFTSLPSSSSASRFFLSSIATICRSTSLECLSRDCRPLSAAESPPPCPASAAASAAAAFALAAMGTENPPDPLPRSFGFERRLSPPSSNCRLSIMTPSSFTSTALPVFLRCRAAISTSVAARVGAVEVEVRGVETRDAATAAS
jgi:hypothetical protein